MSHGYVFFTRQLNLQGDADLTAVSVADPEQTWTRQGEAKSTCRLFAGGGAVVAHTPFAIAAWDLATGEPLWQYQHTPGMLEWLADTPGRLYFHEFPDDEVVCFDAHTGQTHLIGPGGWNMASIAWIDGDRLYVHSEPRQEVHQDWLGAYAVPAEPAPE